MLPSHAALSALGLQQTPSGRRVGLENHQQMENLMGFISDQWWDLMGFSNLSTFDETKSHGIHMDPTFTPVSSHVFPRFFRWFFPGAAACGASASSDGALCSPGASPGRFARGLRYPVPRRTSGTANKQLVKNDLVNLLVNKMLMPIMFDHVSARVSELRGSWFFHMGYERESC